METSTVPTETPAGSEDLTASTKEPRGTVATQTEAETAEIYQALTQPLTVEEGQEPKPEGEGEAKPSDAEVAAKRSRSEKRIQGLVGKLKTVTAERDALAETGKPPIPVAKAEPATTGVHPALEGLVQGQTEETEGLFLDPRTKMWVTPEYLTDRYDQDQEMAGIRDWRKTEEGAKEEAKLATAAEELFGEIETQIVGEITGGMKVMFPNLPAERAPKLESRLLRDAEDLFLSAIEEGEEPSRELVEKISASVLQDAKDTFAIFGQKQIEDNEKYKTEHKTKPGGTPGTPVAKPYHEMTKAEQREFTRQAARAAEGLVAGE